MLTENYLKAADMTLPENQKSARVYCAGLIQGVSESITGKVSESYVKYVLELLIGPQEAEI